MSIACPADAVVIADTATAPKRPITAAGEAELAANVHYLRANARTPIVSTVFAQDESGTAGVQPYISGASSAAQVQAVWCVPVLGAIWAEWEITALAENTSGTHAGKLRLTRASDGTYTEITVPASSAQWTTVTGTLAIDTAQSREQLRLYVINGATGTTRIHSIEIRHKALTSIAAAAIASPDGSSLTWRPVDSTEVADDAPLSVALRNRLHRDLEFTRRWFLDTIVGWSDTTLYRTAAYQVTSTPYVEAFRVPFIAPALRRKVRWALYGFVTTGTGYVRLSTSYSRSAGIADVELQLAVGWTSPFATNLLTYASTGASALECADGQADELRVEVKGTNASIMSLVAWLVDP